ncbi:restriction endonuclease subunit S [Enterococcus faecalis]|nr:restriction endonuclease subunit S [Enterococcus faecalis]
MDASLNQKLASVEWGEYSYSDIFELVSSDKLLTKQLLSEKGKYPTFSSDSTNNGIVGYSNIQPSFVCDDNNPIFVIFGDHTRTFNIAQHSFNIMDNVKVLKPKQQYTLSEILFITSSWKKGIKDIGYARHWKFAKETKILLPMKNGKIDFDFMDSFIAELEAERIAELSAYLTVSGLDNYELSVEELKALRDYDSMEWREYRIGSLFSRISTKKLPYKAKNLPTEALDDYELPCLTSSFRNQGLNYYVPREGATILKDVISIPSNSDVYRAYFQSREFTVLSDAYAIKWTDEDRNLSNYQYLFMVRAINKVTDLPIYSYKMKLGGWNVVKDKKILLPVIDDEIAFNFMEDYARAISKLAIKDVVQYTNERIETTK